MKPPKRVEEEFEWVGFCCTAKRVIILALEDCPDSL